MAKWNRKVIGSVLKAKDGGADYIKIANDVVLTKGSTLKLESKVLQLKNLDEAVATGKLPADMAAKVRENIMKTPDFVRFQIVQLQKV